MAGQRSPTPDPINLHEYMMADARIPKIESLLHPSPPPSVAPGNSPRILPAFHNYQASTPGAFTNPFDATKTSPPIATTTLFAPPKIYSQKLPIDPTGRTPTAAPQLSISSAIGSPRPGEPVDHICTPDSVRANGASGRLSDNGLDNHGMHALSDGNRIEKDASAMKGKKLAVEKETIEQTPAWTEMRTKAGKERKRLPLACIACRRKKIRCSGEKPACKHCLRSRIPCVYKVTTRKAAPRTDYMAMLDKRLKRMEDRVIKLIPKENQPSVPRAVVRPSLPAPPSKIVSKKRVAEEAFGPELDSWAKSRNPSRIGDTMVPAKIQDAEERGLLIEGANALPSKEIQEHLAEVYFDFVYGQSYPLLHKPSFMRRLAAGNVAPVLVLAVCAVSARFSNHPQVRSEPAFLRGEDWARSAREIALRRYDAPNITILIVYLLLGLHEFGTCHGGRSWMIAGMAQRMAYALLLHKDLDHNEWGKEQKESPEPSPTDREIRRRTLWSCFLMDRFNASGTDRPMQMSEDFLNIPLPIKEHYFEMELSAPTETLSGEVLYPAEANSGQMTNAKANMGTSAYYIMLVSIWGRIIHYWNLGGREKETYDIWDERSEFHKLREAVRSFNTNIPESVRWNPENLANHASGKTANQFVFLHLVYHQINLFMNRWALPFSGFREPPKNMPPQFYAESARSALDAANQVSALVKKAIEYTVTAPFAGYCAFYSSTVHIHGVFSKSANLEASSKQNLAYNVKYLSKMKKYWGMFHFVAENLKELYRKHADASLRGPNAAGQCHILQYGDWFDRYPHGVSQTDYEDPVARAKVEPGTDAVLGLKSDVQSVEEFFATLSPPSKAAELRKKAKKAKAEQKAAQKSTEDKCTAGKDGSQSNGPLYPVEKQPALRQPAQSLLTSGFLPNNNLHNNDMSLFNNTNPLVQPGILSQLDRHIVLSSYAGVDPNSASSTTGSTGNDQDVSSMTSTCSNPYAVNDGVGNGMHGMQDMWNMDLSSMGMTNFGGVQMDASSAWFMPFNLDPSDIVGDEAAYSPAGLTGNYDIGMSGLLTPGLDGFPHGRH
ncbi:hypothetical protein BLS_002880 [Venturia inaequalis]|uniref:Zn(2)-C6 fungal-type domain-containing protein n=1 Tax=Venturia inaequalis TaxID=5025 RepID=A0A8H3YU69_VENIN|nr:hypothetical protein EG328_004270 [Venturia inaequalis]KAE9974828.1 hypothetical protein BLS_002880 [Venturia inaequalis]KAE9989594.1 hypothetical protein EG327_002471 [Venturia inaequalis]